VKPAFAYYGGKTRLAPLIAGLLPDHRVYVEPFAGSAAVLFAKKPSVHEILNDLDGHVVHFYRMLRERPEDLELACRLTPYARTEHADCDPDDPSIDDLERARRWYCRLNQSYSKNGSGATGWSTSIRRGSNNARSVMNRIGRFADIAERLANVTIEHRDALDVIAEYSDPAGVIYADPPYLDATRTAYADGRRPHGEYRHEFATQAQHEALATALHASPSTVFLSGYHSELYDDLYAGWDSIERQVVRSTAVTKAATRSHATEVIWSNRPIKADRQAQLFSEVTA
jgi:DNA adenine methylase